MHDRDRQFTKSFDTIFEAAGAEGKQTAFRYPNTNAYVERFIQTLQQDVLDYFVVFGEQHMDHLVSEMVEHYHEERPHQSVGNEPPVNRQATEVSPKRIVLEPTAQPLAADDPVLRFVRVAFSNTKSSSKHSGCS